jgi:ADP-ribose pyrophosphatase YjhB (NUDIX family)
MDRLIDSGFRFAYRLVYRVLWLWWFLRRPAHCAAAVAVWHEGHVLMLRTSYRAVLEFPGGQLTAGETARDGARRELAEEVGIEVAPEALSLRGEVETHWEYRHDHVTVFELRLARLPALSFDRREIVAADFMTREAALAAPLSAVERAYLETVTVP